MLQLLKPSPLRASKSQIPSLRAAAPESLHTLERVFYNRSHRNEKPILSTIRESPHAAVKTQCSKKKKKYFRLGCIQAWRTSESHSSLSFHLPCAGFFLPWEQQLSPMEAMQVLQQLQAHSTAGKSALHSQKHHKKCRVVSLHG